MGKSHGADVMGDSRGGLSGTVSEQNAGEDKMLDKKGKKVAGAIGSAIAQAGAAMDQQPQQVQAGPQIGQAQQAPMVDQGQPLNYLDAYKRNLMYGNSFYGE